jgi:hypothetical protein
MLCIEDVERNQAMAIAGSVLGAHAPSWSPSHRPVRMRHAELAAPRLPVQLHHGLHVVVSYADASRETMVF